MATRNRHASFAGAAVAVVELLDDGEWHRSIDPRPCWFQNSRCAYAEFDTNDLRVAALLKEGAESK
jgi:hypothetical protein